MSAVVVERVSKIFGDFTAVDNLNMEFAAREVTCLLGPSGCGKTTLMRMIAGLETPTRGRILFGSRDVTGLPPRRRDVGMVFQYPVMYPTLTVAENIALPLTRDRSIAAAERLRRVEEVLDVLDMRAAADSFIDELDSGSRQKVAVGRAVARQSEIVLFDEPTTNVEVHAKMQLIRAFKEVAIRLRQTIIYVTHDQTEAMTLADRIALMRDGRIVQYDVPRRLYNEPTTSFGGWFLGNPGMNFIPAALVDGCIAAPVLDAPLSAPAGIGSQDITIGIRPEQILMSAMPEPGSVPGTLVDQVVGIAGRYLTRVRVGDIDVKVKTDARPPVPLGSLVHLVLPRNRLMLFSAGKRVI